MPYRLYSERRVSLVNENAVTERRGNTHHSHTVIGILQSRVSHYLLPGSSQREYTLVL